MEVIKIDGVIDDLLKDISLIETLKKDYSKDYQELYKDYDNDEETATYYLIIMHLCRENKTEYFSMYGDVYRVARLGV